MSAALGPVPALRPFARWGAEREELDRPMPCDAYVEEPHQTLVRAVSVDAPAADTFRWLCQLRAAPYSYDLIDNWGRPSPRTLTPGLEELEVGQRVMTIFRLVEFEPGRSITVVYDGRVFGRVAVTYEARHTGPSTSRLFARLLVRYRGGPLGAAMSLFLPPGDLVMMRKQLLNLRDRAEAMSA